jgi:hypothetical protein
LVALLLEFLLLYIAAALAVCETPPTEIVVASLATVRVRRLDRPSALVAHLLSHAAGADREDVAVGTRGSLEGEIGLENKGGGGLMALRQAAYAAFRHPC